jgi:glucose/arabinose dehydrogenase
MKRNAAFLLLALALSHSAVAEQPAPAQPGGKLPGKVAIQLVKVADDLVDPVAVAASPDGTGRWFVCERPGVVQVIGADGKKGKRPFLDIKDKTLSSFLEEGLLSMTFHPKFK